MQFRGWLLALAIGTWDCQQSLGICGDSGSRGATALFVAVVVLPQILFGTKHTLQAGHAWARQCVVNITRRLL